MNEKPTVVSLLSIVGSVYILLSASATLSSYSFSIPSNYFLLLPSITSGLLVLLFGAMLYIRSREHLLWGGGLVAVSIIDLLGIIYSLYAPIREAVIFTVIGGVGPLAALVGGW